MNYVNRVEPIGISRSIRVCAKRPPQVYTPFNAEDTRIERAGAGYVITLTEKIVYALMRFSIS